MATALLTKRSADLLLLGLPRQALRPSTAPRFPKRAVLPARLGELASVAVAELEIVVEPRMKGKPLLTS